MMKMRHRAWLMKRMNSRTVLSAFSLVFALSLAAPFSPVSAQVNQQNGPVKRGPIERIAEGKVVDKAGDAIGGAVVYLKDSRTNAVKTYIADDSGHYRFGNLSQNTDYELWAESSGVRSKSKVISSFNSDNHFYFALKVSTAKAGSLD
jgi:hypothetical protein